MVRRGRPSLWSLSHPRRHGVFVRFSDTEWGALEQARERDHAVAGRRPTLPEWIRDLVVAHAGEILGVEVARSALRSSAGGVPDGKRWRLSRAVRRAAPRRCRGDPHHPLRDAPKMRLGARGRSATLRGAPSRLPLPRPLNPMALQPGLPRRRRGERRRANPKPLTVHETRVGPECVGTIGMKN
jgi:hypothetical protein